MQPKAKALAASKHAPPPQVLRLLTVNTGDEQSRAVPAGGQITIGRSSSNDLIIAEEHVSGQHARLAGDGAGSFELFDLNSSCGTFINGVQVQHAVLQSGDRIRFGIVDCVFIIIGSDGEMKDDVRKPPLAPKLPKMPSLPQVEDSGIAPLPLPKPADQPGRQIPLIR